MSKKLAIMAIPPNSGLRFKLSDTSGKHLTDTAGHWRPVPMAKVSVEKSDSRAVSGVAKSPEVHAYQD